MEGANPDRVNQVENLLDRARRLHAEGRYAEAIGLAESAEEQGRRALQEAMQARALAQRSAALQSVVEPMIQQAERLCAESDDATLRRLASRAREHYSTALQLNAEQQTRQRVRMFEASMREAERVIRELDREGFDRGQAARRVDAAEDALDRATDVAAQGEISAETEEQIAQGRSLIEQARQALEQDDFSQALALAERARELAQSVVRRSFGPIDAERVQEALARTDALIEQAASVEGEQARELLNQARTRQEDARSMVAGGEVQRALVQTRVAARLAQRALTLSRPGE